MYRGVLGIFCKESSCNPYSHTLDPHMFLLYHSEGCNAYERCFISVMSTTCALQHAVVCWVTAAGIRANVLTLGLKPFLGDHVGWVVPIGSHLI